MRKSLFAVAFTLCLSLAAFGQGSAGLASISGSVKDSSGAAVPGAKVVVSNPAKGITRELTSNENGLFSAPALVPSDGYKVTVNKQGFAPWEANDLALAVGSSVELNISLNVGAVAEKVDVVAAGIAIEDKADVSQVIDSRQIQDLPINGRRVDQFAVLAPAVTLDGTFGLLSFRGTVTGNSFLTDGNDTTNQYYMENAGRTRATSQISGDAVQEFQVISAAGAAEFGRANGGIINTVTKSGSNGIHGTAFWFFRNRTLDARDRFATINPPEVRHQYGGSIGGPIKKDKLFYFLNTEITRRHFPMVSSQLRPGTIDPNNMVWLGCSAPATAAQCSAINSLLPRFFGLVDRSGNQELGFGKIDYRPNERNSLTFQLNYLRFISPNGIQTGIVSTTGAALGTNGLDSVRHRSGKASWTAVPTNSIVNEARFGWYKDRQADDVNPALAKGWPIGNTSLSVAGVSTLGGYNVLPRINPSENRFQYADNLSWTKGRHSMKFGVDISRTEDYSSSLTNRYGSYTYSSVTAFAQDFTSPAAGPSHYQSYTQAFGNPIVDTYITDIAWFAQDSFKVTPKLTVNFGLRYDHSFLPQPTITNPAYPQTGVIHSSSKDFAPRLGFAYALNNKTVLRGGYGLYYARYGSGMVNTLFSSNSVYQTSAFINSPTAAGAPVFPNILASSAAATGATSIFFASPNLRTPYSIQYDVALERQLSHSVSLSVSYIGSRGKQLLSERDLNVGPLSSTTATYTIEDSNYAAAGTYTTPLYLFSSRVDKNFSRVMQVENTSMSWYDGMAVQLNKRFSNYFSGQVSYTWSHALDENGSTGGNSASTIFLSGSSPTGLYNGGNQQDKGNAQLDQRHKLGASFLVKPKFTSSNSAFARYFVNGWEWGGILTLGSGRPLFETISSTLTTANFPGAFTGTVNGLGGDNRVPFLQQNPLRADGVARFDTRITKRLIFNERFSATLNFEVFNLTNTISNFSYFTQGYVAGNLGTLAAPKYTIAPCTVLAAAPTATVCGSPGPGTGSGSGGFPDGTNARRAQVSARFVF